MIRPKYDLVWRFSDGLARVAWGDGGYGYINKRGEAVWKHAPVKKEGML